MNIIKINVLIYVLSLVILLMGCTIQEIEYSIEMYGEEKAYILDQNGNIVTLEDPMNTIFLIEIGSYYNEYRFISEYALNAANQIEGINFSFTFNLLSTTQFSFYKGDSAYPDIIVTPSYGEGCGSSGVFTKPGDTSTIVCSIKDDEEVIAINSFDYILNDNNESKIYYSHIVFFADLMDLLTTDEKKTVALHELGHTLGLIDYEEQEVIGYTVMFYQLTQPYVDYSDCDKYNLEWYYKYGGN